MKPNKIYLATLIAFFSYSAHAQFPGDVFFSEPSIAVSSGQKGTLDLEIFTGDKIFGATQFEISYDKSMIQIENITAKNDDFENTISWAEVGSNIGVISVNGVSKSKPFGTIKLATINFQATAQAGTRAIISIDVVDSIDPTQQSYSSNTGYSAEINITDATTSQARARESENTVPATPATAIKVSSGELYERARSMRPSGEMVTLKTLDPTGKLVDTTVQAIDMNNISE